jgi:hypothetical protein
MSTNGAIGVVVNGKIKAVYVHWDSYVDGVGKTLVEHYNQEKTEQLVALGSISVLGKNIGTKHPFDLHDKNVCTFYGRDRDEEDVDAKMFDTANEFMEWFDGGEYWYILGTDGIWYFSEGDPLAWKRVDGAIDWK